MSSTASIKLIGDNIDNINQFIDEIKNITEKLGVSMRGPIPLPTKKLRITTRRSPDGEGKYSQERYQIRIYKRLINIQVDERVLRMIMKIKIPSGLNIEVKLI